MWVPTYNNKFMSFFVFPVFHIAGYLLLYASACVNPIIYVIMNAQYRAAYAAALCLPLSRLSGLTSGAYPPCRQRPPTQQYPGYPSHYPSQPEPLTKEYLPSPHLSKEHLAIPKSHLYLSDAPRAHRSTPHLISYVRT